MSHRHIKRWGQVFLRNKGIQERIGEYVNGRPFNTLVEVGPGDGALTKHVSTENKRLFLVEIDKKLATYLKTIFVNAEVIQGDFLDIEIDLKDKVLLFGNIPYYITSQIILKFLKSEFYEEAILMMQKECYESMSSKCSTKKYSSFSALLQSLTQFWKILDVDRYNFYPVPKVDSVVVHFKKKESRLRGLVNEYALFLRGSFFMPRKTLSNNFKKFMSSEDIKSVFMENGIEENVRPDAVSPEKYEEIFLSESFSRCRKG